MRVLGGALEPQSPQRTQGDSRTQSGLYSVLLCPFYTSESQRLISGPLIQCSDSVSHEEGSASLLASVRHFSFTKHVLFPGQLSSSVV